MATLENFNPRSRKESDHSVFNFLQCCVRFQSTLSQGERRGKSSLLSKFIAFQSTLSQGERQTTHGRHSYLHHFNPRSRKESDRLFFIYEGEYRYFNPRSRKESDLEYRPACPPGKYFNPRSRKESDCDAVSCAFFSFRFQSTLSQGERHGN